VHVARLAPLLFLAACTPAALSAERQECIECALRAHRAPEAAAAIAGRLTRECEAGEAGSCSILGVMYERGTGRMHRPDTAAHLYRLACRGGNLRSCVHLGRLLETGLGTRADLAGAELTYELACHGGEAEGCAGQGRLLIRRGELQRGANASRRACVEGSGDGCFAMASLYREGSLTEGADDRARRYDIRACGLGHEPACSRATAPIGSHPGDRAPGYLRASSRATAPQ